MEKSPCFQCFQKECGMRGTPMSWDQINLRNGYKDPPPTRHIPCFFFTCDIGAAKATEAMNAAKISGESGLIPFSSDDKPHHDEKRSHGITGRYVALNASEYGLEDGDIVVLKEHAVVLLTNIIKRHPARFMALLRALSKNSA